MMKINLWLILLIITCAGKLTAQNYNAIHGSNYSGALGVYNNPSSIVNSPFRWDMAVIAAEYHTVTNALQGKNFPFYFSPQAKFRVASGNFSREADLHGNLRLINTRISLDKTQALAFGINLKAYTQATTSKVNYSDSVTDTRSFLLLNEQNRVLTINMASSAWMEFYGSYGRTIWDREASRLNAGATVKLLRGLSGGFAKINDVGVERADTNDFIVYRLTDGGATYGYSANHGDGDSFQAGDLVAQSKTGFAVDLGVEYLVKTQAVNSVYDDNDYHDYEWKIGISLLDLGWNNYTYGRESRRVSSLDPDVTSDVLHQKFTSIDDLATFNDSLATIVDESTPLTGNFRVANPARAVINIDRYITGRFYLNGELSINLASGTGDKIAVKESKLLTVTPRWETSRMAFSFPVQVNRHGNFWIGGALRAGPLLLGTHNLLNMFSKHKDIRGGAYIALIIRPRNFLQDPSDRQYDCPKY